MWAKNFNYEITIEDDVDADFLEISPLLMQLYVENASWHGLMHKMDGNRNLDVLIEKENEFLIIKIEDNEIARKASEVINSNRKMKKESLGLKISEDQIKLLKRIYGRKVTALIEDLENPTGTRVLFSLPIGDY